MARSATGRPTDSELEILKVLWQDGPSTVRHVWQEVSQQRTLGYTSVLKIMQIMRDKGIVICDDSQRPQLFRASQRQRTVLKKLTQDLLDRAFDGSTRNLVLHALDSKKATAKELAAIRKLLDEIEGE